MLRHYKYIAWIDLIILILLALSGRIGLRANKIKGASSLGAKKKKGE
jgi:hypothetical protein